MVLTGIINDMAVNNNAAFAYRKEPLFSFLKTMEYNNAAVPNKKLTDCHNTKVLNAVSNTVMYRPHIKSSHGFILYTPTPRFNIVIILFYSNYWLKSYI